MNPPDQEAPSQGDFVVYDDLDISPTPSMSISKFSDVRHSNIPELQEFLKLKGVPFETDSNKQRLVELAKGWFDEQAALTTGENGPAKDENGAQDEEQGGPKEDTEEVEGGAGKTEETVDKTKDTTPSKTKKETEKERDTRLSEPGARREEPLQDLISEMSRKGFNNKQEMADLLEANVREARRLTEAKRIHDERERELDAREMKLDQRIKDNEVIFAQVHTAKAEAEQILEQAVRIQQQNERIGRGK